MGTLKLDDCAMKYQCASDVDFDGIRLEVLSDDGHITINTFGKDVPTDLIAAAVEIARRPR